MSALTEMENVRIMAVSTLRVSFMLEGVDITNTKTHANGSDGGAGGSGGGGGGGGPADGSDHLLVRAGSGRSAHATHHLLFLCAHSVPHDLWLTSVAMAIRHGCLANRPRDLLPLTRMLDARPEGVGAVLQFMRIPLAEMSDHLGTELSRGAAARVARTALSPSKALVKGGRDEGREEASFFAPGEEIAFVYESDVDGGGGGGAGSGSSGWVLVFRQVIPSSSNADPDSQWWKRGSEEQCTQMGTAASANFSNLGALEGGRTPTQTPTPTANRKPQIANPEPRTPNQAPLSNPNSIAQPRP